MANTSPLVTERRAAMYVRMSTEMQQYSTQNQANAIQVYAKQHNFNIVRRFEDNGKSGLQIARRPGLSDLLKEVQSGNDAFRDILVYDVSRWGRFQDVDESAFYEHLCKRANVTVHYCAEPFQNDGSISSALLKAIKRSMAGEYSRELSVKVFAGQVRLIEMGYRQGGRAGFGLRRQLIDSNGKEKCVLQAGDYKCLQTDRVILIPGPEDEVSILREIFNLFTIDGQSETQISRLLNARGVKNDRGELWHPVLVKQILQNPKYIGSNLYHRTSRKLLQKCVFNPPSKWIRRDNAFEPLVSVAQFEQAQQIFQARKMPRFSSEQLLENLRALLARTGKLTAHLINQDRSLPRARAFQARFKSLPNAYKLVGYQTRERTLYDAVKVAVKFQQAKLYGRIKSDLLIVGATVEEQHGGDVLAVNGQFTVLIAVSYCAGAFTRPRWNVHFRPSVTPDFLIVARMNLTNDGILDYFVLPVIDRPMKRFTLCLQNPCRYDVYRFDNLSHFINLARRRCPVGYL